MLNDDITHRWGCATIWVILRTNRARFTLSKENLDLLDEESVSGANSGRAIIYKFDEKSTASF